MSSFHPSKTEGTVLTGNLRKQNVTKKHWCFFFFYPLVSSSLTGSRTDEFLSPSLIMSVLLTTDRNTSRPSPVCLQRFLRLHRLNMYESEYSYNNTNLQSNSLCMCIYFHINIYGCGFLFNTAKIINIHGFLVCLFAGLN